MKLLIATSLVLLIASSAQAKWTKSLCRGSKCAKINDLELHLDTNAKEHQTTDYELTWTKLIVRRGQAISMSVRHEGFNFEDFQLRIKVKYGLDRRSKVKVIPIRNGTTFLKGTNTWDARVASMDSARMNIEIRSPAEAAVGTYALQVDLKAKGSVDVVSRAIDEFYVLFNPFSEDDPVFMPNETMRNEYLMSDVGKVYQGSTYSYGGHKWIYGQFVEDIVPIVARLLAKSGFNEEQLGDIVTVSRVLSSLVNANDNGGVIMGKWNGSYDDGRQPSEWVSSVPILRQYDQTGASVRYGQCWVFAATLTTVCRALGIPARPVTNFASAHDTDDSLTIDTFVSETMEEIEGFTSDSTWNFHVWTEAWFSRTDIPDQYSGWQAIDATPQEKSDGIFQTGPGAIAAVKRGDVNFRYDLHFIFAEVSALTITWQRNKSTPLGWKMIKGTDRETGTLLVTKKIGDVADDYGISDAEDITSEYKDPDKHEHRAVVVNAMRRAGVQLLYPELKLRPSHDVECTLQKLERTTIGSPFKIVVTAVNRANGTRTLAETLVRVASRYYNGVPANSIKLAKFNAIVLKPGESRKFELTVTSEEYLNKLVEQSIIKVYAMITVEETDQVWTEDEDLQFTKPQLKLAVIGNVTLGQAVTIDVELTNPLDIILTNCRFSAEGHVRYTEVTFRDIQPHETVKTQVIVYADKVNYRDKVVNFRSDQLREVRGTVRLTI